jgi:anion transporter
VKITWRTVAPLCIWLAIYLVPAPAGLNANQWHYFALFAAVIAGLILESMPVGAVGLIGLTVAGVMGYVEPDPNKSLRWMLGGFSESTVWLIVGAFVFSIGYRKSGLGRRLALMLVRGLGRSTIGLGYAVAFSDLVLAPATPSNTARSGGTIYPIVSNIPRIYGSEPGPTAGKIGTYVMWTAFATTAVTSSLFLTALALQCRGAEHRQEDRERRYRLVAMVHRLRTAGNSVAAAGAVAGLCHLPAASEGRS